MNDIVEKLSDIQWVVTRSLQECRNPDDTVRLAKAVTGLNAAITALGNLDGTAN